MVKEIKARRSMCIGRVRTGETERDRDMVKENVKRNDKSERGMYLEGEETEKQKNSGVEQYTVLGNLEVKRSRGRGEDFNEEKVSGE